MSANKKSSNEMNLAQFVSNIPVRKKLIDQNDRDKFEWNQVCIRINRFVFDGNQVFPSGKVQQNR